MSNGRYTQSSRTPTSGQEQGQGRAANVIQPFQADDLERIGQVLYILFAVIIWIVFLCITKVI